MNGFEQIAGLLYCIEAIYESHPVWRHCLKDQFYENMIIKSHLA